MIERLFHARSNFLGNSNRLLVSQALFVRTSLVLISTAFCALELAYPYLRLPFSNGLIHFRDGPALAPLRFHTIKEPPPNKPSEIAAKNRCANPSTFLVVSSRVQRDATHGNPKHS